MTDDDIRAAAAEGLTCAASARRFGVARSTMHRRAIRLGVRFRKARPQPPYTGEPTMLNGRVFTSQREAARQLGASRRGVQDAIARGQDTIRPRRET